MALIDSQRSDIATAHIMFYLIDFPKSVLKAVSEDQVLALLAFRQGGDNISILNKAAAQLIDRDRILTTRVGDTNRTKEIRVSSLNPEPGPGEFWLSDNSIASEYRGMRFISTDKFDAHLSPQQKASMIFNPGQSPFFQYRLHDFRRTLDQDFLQSAKCTIAQDARAVMFMRNEQYVARTAIVSTETGLLERMIERFPGHTATRIQLFPQKYSGIWLPTVNVGFSVDASSLQVIEIRVLVVTKAEVNMTVDPAIFDPKIPKGFAAQDHRDSFVSPKSSYLRNDVAFTGLLSRKRSPAGANEPTPETANAASRPFVVLVVILNMLFLLCLLGAMFWRKRRRGKRDDTLEGNTT